MADLKRYNKDFIIYTDENDKVHVEAFVHSESIWLTQKSMSELFGVGVPAISKHLKNIFKSYELNEKEVVSILEITTQHGAIKGKTQKNPVTYYNLDAIIAVGYRVNSKKATKFRIWATKVLKEYIIKGFVLDDDRLKYAKSVFGKDYFDVFRVLDNKGPISNQKALQKAWEEYKIFNKTQKIESDFEKQVKILKNKNL